MSEKQKEINETDVKFENTKEIELPTIDLNKYIGNETIIDKVEEKIGEHGEYILVSSPVLELLGKKEIPVLASRIFSLQKDDDGNLGWGKDTLLGVFLKTCGVKHYKKLIGVGIILQKKPANKDKKEFLTFEPL